MEKRKSKKLRLILSVIALVEVLAIAVGVTFSWVEGGNKGTVKGNEIVISSGSNLTMLQNGNNTNSISIPVCTLEETSSSDGRNYFFPMGDNKTNKTNTMTFREGTASDKNQKYISIDFDLIANSNAADVYLGAGTIVQSKNKNLMNALRMSFSTNDGTTPVVFKPNQMPGITASYSPIVAITSEGVPTTATANTKSYGDYYYEGETSSTPLFEIGKDETKHITLSIWLEGTAFSSDDIANQDLSIYIDFTTTLDDLVKYKFVDNTHGYSDGNLETWVKNTDELHGNTYETMMYVYDKDSSRYYSMNKITDTEWEIYIPKSIKHFYFRRYSIDIDQWWNQWEPNMNAIPTYKNEHVYVAICGNGASEGVELDGCYGYWKDAYGTFRIYFEMQAPYSDLHCYAWNTSGTYCASTGEWPGKGMTFVKNTDNGVLYCVDLKESENIAGIQFNNGGKTRVYLEGFNYSTNTAAYAYYKDGNGNEIKPLGNWPGTKASYDSNNTIGHYWVDFDVTVSNHNRTFNIIANNNNNGSQYPGSGDGPAGQTGGVYKFTNNSMNMAKLAGPYDISGDNFKNKIYNGAVFWYKSDNETGYYVYRDKESSLIFPTNDPTP